MHHLESRLVGGNAPNNLITLCADCHKAFHAGKIPLDKFKKKRGKPLRDAAFMGIMRKTLMARLQAELCVPVEGTYGYITKMLREKNNIEKSHTNDALCIAKHPKAEHCDTCYRSKPVRHHNRKLHKETIGKKGIRKANKAPYLLLDFRLWDKVRYNGEECFVSGRRSAGTLMLKRLDGTAITNSVNYKKVTLLEMASKYPIERM